MEYTSLAQAVGEEPGTSPAFVAGENFDPADTEEVETVQAATERHRADIIPILEREIARLESELERARAHRDGPTEDEGTIEFLGTYEAEEPAVLWSGQANDDSVLALVKWGPSPGEYLLLWYVEREWQRADGSARQWMFERDAQRSEQFGIFTKYEAAVEAAKAALTEHCGKEWS